LLIFKRGTERKIGMTRKNVKKEGFTISERKTCKNEACKIGWVERDARIKIKF